MDLAVKEAVRKLQRKNDDAANAWRNGFQKAVVDYVAQKTWMASMGAKDTYTVKLKDGFSDDWDLNPMRHVSAEVIINKMVELGVEIIEHVPTVAVKFLGIFPQIKYGYVTFRVPSAD